MQQISQVNLLSESPVWVHQGKGDSRQICVIQKGCAISKQPMATSSFGPCYIFVGKDPVTGYGFLAHIDDMTDVESVHNIFCKLAELGVDKKNLTHVQLLGGWKEHPRGALWGEKIIEILKGEDVKVGFPFFQQKKMTADGAITGQSNQTHYTGGIFNPSSGKFDFFAKPWKLLGDRQNKNDQHCITYIFNRLYGDMQQLSMEDQLKIRCLSEAEHCKIACQNASLVSLEPLHITVF